jgi:hypothetical protein
MAMQRDEVICGCQWQAPKTGKSLAGPYEALVLLVDFDWSAHISLNLIRSICFSSRMRTKRPCQSIAQNLIFDGATSK